MLNSTKNKKEKVKSRFLSGKKITTLLLSILLANAVQAQSPNWLWAKAMGGAANDLRSSVAVDASGNVYTTGSFNGTADFDPGAGVFNLTSAGGPDIFISKLDSSGNFVWAKAMGGTSWDFGYSIAIDPAGSGAVYTTGSFEGTADFDPGSGTFNLTAVGGTFEDIFISKLDASGNFVWAKAVGGIYYDDGTSIAIDPAGSGALYTTGVFWGTADFDPGAGIFNLTSAGYGDIFISKLDSSGNFVWAKAMGGTNGQWGNSIAIDPAGSGALYTTGAFAGTVDFDPGAGVFNLTSAGGISSDIFISKLDSSGNFVWAKQMGGIDGDGGNSIAIDPAGSGDIYTTGSFIGTVDFDPGAGVFNLTAVGGIFEDIFISKLDSSGNFVWAKAMGGIDLDYGYSIAIDPAGSGDVYTTGTFWGTVDFDPGAGVFNLTSAVGSDDIFISKLDGSGNFVWAKAAGGIYNDIGNSIALDASGSAYITGSFESPSIAFASTTLTNAGPVNTTDIFIAKLDTMTIITGNNDASPDGSASLNMTGIFPNPFSGSTVVSFSLSQSQQISLKIFDVNGRLVSTLATQIFEAGKNELVWNAGELNAGIYFLQLQSEENLQTEKLIVTK